MTGHRSEELERYKHLSASFKQQSVELIAGKLTTLLATKLATPHTPKAQKAAPKSDQMCLIYERLVAEPTGLEPATSDVTGRRSNQLNYDSAEKFDSHKTDAPRGLRLQAGRHGGTRTHNLRLVRAAVYH